MLRRSAKRSNGVDMAETTDALVYAAPGEAEIRAVPLPELAPGWVEIATSFSALSRGTERLVFSGAVPESEWQRMRAPFQEGDFPFPVKYGYAAAGRVEAGPEALLGRSVFCLYPHQRRFRVPAEAAIPLPEGVPEGRAVLAANMETALNAVWDAAPAPGARALIVGAGLLGILIAAVLARRGDITVHVCDVISERASAVSEFPVTFSAPDAVDDAFDLAFHTSATAAGLETALDALAFEGTVWELSWFGDRPVPVPLGRAFHSRRLSLRCSQVGQVAAPRRATVSHRDRLSAALDILVDPRLDALLTEEVAFDALPAAIGRLLAPGASGIATRVRY